MTFWMFETRYSLLGHPSQVWGERRLRLPRTDDEVLDTSIYLYRSASDARAGSYSGASGFLFSIWADSSEPAVAESLIKSATTIRLSPVAKDIDGLTGRRFCYAVTSAHVVDKSPIIRLNTRDGDRDIIELKATDWIKAKNSVDLAVAPVKLTNKWSTLSISLEMCLTEGEAKELEVGIGDDVHMVGRFINHAGKQRNRPVVRFGNISMMPDESEPINLGRGIKPQVAFLIETRTVPGFSGSPVFLWVNQWELLAAPERSVRAELAKRNWLCIRLLGIAGGYMYNQEKGVFVGDDGAHLAALSGTKVEVALNCGMMWCVPAWKLLELLNCESLRRQREEQRERWLTEFRYTPPAGSGA